MPIIEIEGVNKAYSSDKSVLKNLTLTIEEGEFVTLLGPSGCGKTTLLKMLNKLIPYDGGTIKIKGKSLEEWDTIALRRQMGYVIQQIGLLPHLTIEDNITFVQELMGESKAVKSQKAKELIEMVGLDQSMLSQYPRSLSGGQKQRIGVARALAADPDIILMDEPFGAVDEIARTSLQDEIKALQKRLNKTIIFVTHDIEEALKLGSKVVLMNDGGIEQSGPSEDLIFSPKTPFVASFMGVKGFKSVLEISAMEALYDKIKKGQLSLENLYKLW